jgi:hypothetical protein
MPRWSVSGVLLLALQVLTLQAKGWADVARWDFEGDNGQLQLTDAMRILGFLFLGGAAPAPPGPPPSPCGSDPSAVHLGCASYTPCVSPN